MSPEPRDGFDPDERESWEETPHGADDFGDRPGVVFLSDVAPERVDWLWPGRIPLGKLTVLDLVASSLAPELSTRQLPFQRRDMKGWPRRTF